MIKVSCHQCGQEFAREAWNECEDFCPSCGRAATDTSGRTGPSGAILHRRVALAERVRLSHISGKASAAWLIFCLLVTAVLIPAALRLPTWIEFEIVLACWWAIWLVALTWLLTVGFRVNDDYRFGEPRNWLGSSEGTTGWEWADLLPLALDGCAEPLAFVAGLVLLGVVIWFVFEIAIPVILFLLYFAVRGMLAHVVNDRHQCRGHLARALAWAALWATVYSAPLAGAVWFVHLVHRSHGG